MDEAEPMEKKRESFWQFYQGEIVCEVTTWPPKQNAAGYWELAVQGEPAIFDLLEIRYRGCDFIIHETEFRSLLFIKRDAFHPKDETEFPTMVFAYLQTPAECDCKNQHRTADLCQRSQLQAEGQPAPTKDKEK